MMQRLRCPRCGEEITEFNVDIDAMAGDRVIGTFTQRYCGCRNCSVRVSDAELSKKNRKVRNDFWRSYYGFITPEELAELKSKYKVTGRYISAVLRIKSKGQSGESTIWDGELPTMSENERLKKALLDADYFRKQEALFKSGAGPHKRWKGKVRPRITSWHAGEGETV